MAASTTIPAESAVPQAEADAVSPTRVDAVPPAGAEAVPSAGGHTVPARRETIRHPSVESFDLAHVLRTVGDPLRLEIVRALADGGEQLCGPLADGLGVPKSTTSYHLRLLREAGVTRVRAKGTLRYVSLRGDDLEARFPGLLGVLTASTGR
jgi:DNA-binding transcriptional ArsR family regulator